jgi:phthalate 4,5-dioxygenase oxygenase subunit
MLSREENEMLTRVGPGTPMGEVLRRYWMAAALSSELPGPDCSPRRVKLLGEKLVAFRDSTGNIGLVDEFCPHRRTSLFLGRNEESGLRCIYHGWKFNFEGRCLDIPNEDPESDFKSKIRLKAYPTIELGGVVWAYMGPREKMPPPPKFEWTQVPETHRHVSKNRQESNWLQAVEGGIDPCHSSFLHRALTTDVPRSRAGLSAGGYRGRSTAPIQDVEQTEYGILYASIRPLGEEGNYIRTYHYVLPFYEVRADQVGTGGEVKRRIITGHFWVPMDDHNCMTYNWLYSFGEEPLTEQMTSVMEWGAGRAPEDYSDGFRLTRNRENDWLIDRNFQKTRSFSGIEGINTQDLAVQESMEPIIDRSQEHLGPSDRVIILARRILLQAIKTVQEGGDPPGVNPSYYKIRAIERLLPVGADWRKELQAEIVGNSVAA